jgi:Fur family ferric uptake transcriptional regulator
MESLSRILQESGFKVTKPRLKLLQVMAEAKSCALSADDLYKLCGKELDLVTIYRNLRAFEKKGVVTRADLGDGFDRFELQAHNRHHHHHLVCRDCRKVVKLPSCPLEQFEKFAQRKGFTALSHHLEVFGLCSACA